MTTSFTFPPPPPPPPKATLDPGYADSLYSHNNHRGGRAGGRGPRSRGRGFHQQGNAGRGSYGMQGQYAPNNAGNSQFPGGPGYNMPWSMTGALPQHPNFGGIPASHGAHMVSQQPYYQQNAQTPPLQSSPALYNQSPFPSAQSFFPQSNQGFNQPLFAANGHYHASTANGYASQSWTTPVQQISTNSQSMGPPLRIGFNQNIPPTSISYQEIPQHTNFSAPTITCGSTQPFSGYKRKREENQNLRSTSQNRGNFQNGYNKPAKKPKVEVAPAVPSFGAPLPSKPVPSSASTSPDSATGDAANVKKRKKRKRKTNQLGLTPQGEDHEESEEDVDEEALFAVKGGPLQFEYKGKTSVLGSGADIAAWIEERKKRWPTRARVEELNQVALKRKQEQAEARQRVQESRRQDQETRREQQEEAKKKAHESRHKEQQTEHKKAKEEKSDERRKKDLEKHLMKTEKLRKKLEKSELKAAKLAADARAVAAEFAPVTSVVDNHIVKTTVDVENIEGVPTSSEILHANLEGPEIWVEVQEGSKPEAIDTADDIIPATSPCERTVIALDEGTPHSMAVITAAIVVAPQLEPVKPEDATEAEDASRSDSPAMASDATDLKILIEMEDAIKAGDKSDPERLPEVDSDSSNDVSEDSDSSMSSSSSLKSADSNSRTASSGAPEETSSRSNGPVRVPPPKRESTKRGICHKFLANGYCPFGHKCKHRHELPERGTRREKLERKKEKEKDKPAEKRMSLYQRLVEQEQAEENKLVLMAVKKLGEDGFFEGRVGNREGRFANS